MRDAILRIDSGVGRVAVHDVAATRRIESKAADAAAPFALMQAAGAAVARLALAVAPHARTTWIFCGPGNNGGDGLEAALGLHRCGRRVVIVTVGDAAALPADAAEAAKRVSATHVPSCTLAELNAAAEPGDLVVDALLGIGSNRAPDGSLATAIQRIAAWQRTGAHVLAIDVPSGLDADHGQAFGAASVSADETLALLTVKPGLVTGAGGDRVGRLWLATLGTVPASIEAPTAWLVGRADSTTARPPRRPSQHKGSFGDVAVVGGAPTMRGAAWLAASAAHAAGAGRVWVELLGNADAASGNFVRPELMLRPDWSAGDVAALAAAVVVCGCGGGDLVTAVLPRLLSHARRLVLDADALNAIAVDPSLQVLLTARHGRGLATVLTPHPREAARLLDSDVAAVQADRLQAAQALAERYRAVCIVKGSGSVIAAPGATPRINHTGNARLATAGTGDVLAGWTGGRWAAAGAPADTMRDPSDAAFDIATMAVIEHGAAAEGNSSNVLRAADLVEELQARSGR